MYQSKSKFIFNETSLVSYLDSFSFCNLTRNDIVTVDVSESQTLAFRDIQTFKVTTVLPDWSSIQTELSQYENMHLTTINRILVTTNLIKFIFLNF